MARLRRWWGRRSFGNVLQSNPIAVAPLVDFDVSPFGPARFQAEAVLVAEVDQRAPERLPVRFLCLFDSLLCLRQLLGGLGDLGLGGAHGWASVRGGCALNHVMNLPHSSASSRRCQISSWPMV